MKRSNKISLAAGIVVWVGLACCYWFRPGPLALITEYPAWTWPVLAGLSCVVVVLANWRAALVILGMSALFFLAISEEPWSLARGLVPPGSGVGQPGHLRVVSANCAGGDAKAAEEALALSPDILLLPESPSRADTARLCKKLYGNNGGYVWNYDCAIVADGKVQEVPFGKHSSFFTAARVTTRDGQVIGVVCIHLVVPPYHYNPFSRVSWISQAQHRRNQLEQMRVVREFIDQIPPSIPLLVGGDFIAAAGDPVYRPLSPRLRDTFRSAGVGWGDTLINAMPIHRIDQVWVSDAFKPMRVEAVKSIHSDHRMVECDVAGQPGH